MSPSVSKSLLEIPELPLEAFRPVAGRMRLFGKSEAPSAPDYIGQAQATAQGNMDLARAGASANRIDQSTPYGSIQYTRGDGFDQSGYDAAQAAYQQTMSRWNNPNDAQMNQYKEAGGTAPVAPTRDQFTLNPDHWSSTINLSQDQQDRLNDKNYQDRNLAWSANDLSNQVLATGKNQLDISDIPALQYGVDAATGMDAWDKATDLIRQRQNPDLDAQQAALDTKLANMGLTAGSEGWGLQQQQFGKQRNDADMAAQLAGLQAQQQFYGQALSNAQLNNSTRQQGINERVDLRELPMKELQALRSTAGLTNPTFSQPGSQQLTAGADLLGASNSQYNAAVNQTNAQNQQAAGNTQAGVGLLAAAASFY